MTKLVKGFLIVATILNTLVFSGIAALANDDIVIAEDLIHDEVFLESEMAVRAYYGEEFMYHHDNSVVYRQRLLESFPQNRSGELIYPSFYGGSFINEDGKYVVWIVGNGRARMDTISLIEDSVAEEINFIVQHANYSFNELTAMMDFLNDFADENPESPVLSNMNAWYMADNENHIVVEMEQMNFATIAEFKEVVIDSEMIVFTESPMTSSNEVQIQAFSIPVNTTGSGPGLAIQAIYPSGRMDASMGYRARRNGVNGIVTTAHGLNGVRVPHGTVFRRVNNITSVGILEASHFPVGLVSASVDAAWIRTHSSFTPVNTLRASNNANVAGSLSTTTTLPGSGTIINRIGGMTGHAAGRIEHTNVTVTLREHGNVRVTNQTRVDRTFGPASQRGDSGGIYYTFIASTGTRLTAGIHVSSTNNGNQWFFSKATEINRVLGLTRY